jgi:hypothetical protein
MNLQEQVSRIKSMMGVLTEDEVKILDPITGGYSAPIGDCDELHHFEKNGQMNSKVNDALIKLYEQGINPDIKSVRVTLDSSKGTASYIVEIGESTDGKAWVGLDSAGGGATNGLSNNPNYPKNLTVDSGHASTNDRKDAKSIKKRGIVEDMVPIYILEHYPSKGCKVKQIFHKYTLEEYPPHETKVEEPKQPEVKKDELEPSKIKVDGIPYHKTMLDNPDYQ